MKWEVPCFLVFTQFFDHLYDCPSAVSTGGFQVLVAEGVQVGNCDRKMNDPRSPVGVKGIFSPYPSPSCLLVQVARRSQARCTFPRNHDFVGEADDVAKTTEVPQDMYA